MLEKEDLKQIENIVFKALGINDKKSVNIFDSKFQPIMQELDDIRLELREINQRLERIILNRKHRVFL